MELEPMFFDYQLIGDSMLLRFAEQILGIRCKYENGLRRLGYCISGQTLQDLRVRLKSDFYQVSDKVILLIGTNDMIKNSRASRMQARLRSIMKHIREKANEVVILTLPPVPKFARQDDHWFRLNYFNNYIKTLKDDSVRVADVTSLYLNGPRSCRMDYFETVSGCTSESCLVNEHSSRCHLTEYCPFHHNDGSICCGEFLHLDGSSGLRNTRIPAGCPFVEDISEIFSIHCSLVSETHFKLRFYDQGRRVDKIHLNRKGLGAIRDFLVQNNLVVVANPIPENWISGTEEEDRISGS